MGKITTNNSEKYTAKKFIKEYNRILQEMFSGLEDTESESHSRINDESKTKINYIRFKELLLRLGMITGVSGTPNEIQESNLILELWQLTT